jgi:hypothetical protein
MNCVARFIAACTSARVGASAARAYGAAPAKNTNKTASPGFTLIVALQTPRAAIMHRK